MYTIKFLTLKPQGKRGPKIHMFFFLSELVNKYVLNKTKINNIFLK